MSPKAVLTAIRTLEILRIRTDGGTQGRLSIDSAVVEQYGELMENGVEFPPVRTWFDGNEYWLVDGFHRIAAAKRIGAPKISAEVVHGSLDDARWDSYSANSTHGIRRTAADLEAIIRRVLDHPNSHHLSNHQIARHLCLPEATFRRWRKRLTTSYGEDTLCIAVRRGKSYVMETARIGSHQTTSVTKPSYKQLSRELVGAKSVVSPNVRRVLNVIDKWICHHSDTATFIAAIEGVVQSFSRSTALDENKGLTVWFTGLGEAGKPTIAEIVYRDLLGMQRTVEWLDGDGVRQQLSGRPDPSKADCDEDLRIVGLLAERLTRKGVITLVSGVSEHRGVRDNIRERIGRFVEVCAWAPSVAEVSDVAGAEQRASERYQIACGDFHERLHRPDVECRTDRESSEESAKRVLHVIQQMLD